MEGRGALEEFEFFGAVPEIGFIKPKDVVSQEDVWILLVHPLKPRMDHFPFCGIGVNYDIGKRSAIGKDEEMSLHLRTSHKSRSNLNDGISLERDHGTKGRLKELFHVFRSVASVRPSLLEDGRGQGATGAFHTIRFSACSCFAHCRLAQFALPRHIDGSHTFRKGGDRRLPHGQTRKHPLGSLLRRTVFHLLRGLLPCPFGQREITRHGEALNIPRCGEKGSARTRPSCGSHLRRITLHSDHVCRFGNRAVLNRHPATGRDLLNVEKPKHGIQIGLKDLDGDIAQGRVQCLLGGGAKLIIQEEPSKGAKEGQRGNVQLEKGEKGVCRESVKHFFHNARHMNLSHRNTLCGQIGCDGSNRRAGPLFREAKVESGAKSTDVAADGNTCFGRTEEVNDHFAGMEGLLFDTSSWIVLVLIRDIFIDHLAMLVVFGFDVHITALKIQQMKYKRIHGTVYTLLSCVIADQFFTADSYASVYERDDTVRLCAHRL